MAASELFVFTPGVAVPRDVTHVLVSPCVEVVPEKAFEGLVRLRVVVLSEGVRVVGDSAFRNCKWLVRVQFPSTLVEIRSWAFVGCKSLVALHFPDGLAVIRGGAFCGCSSLQRVCFSTATTSVGPVAFSDCSSLRVVSLVDGVQTIGASAFRGCAAEDVILPATLTRVGRCAFSFCPSLRMVKLSGGVHLVEEDTFTGCDLLYHITAAPKCFVVEKIGENISFSFATDGTISSNTEFERVVIDSDCFHSMSSHEVSALEIAMTEVLGTNFGEEWDDKCERLRALLAPHERRRKKEVTTLLELGLWKAEMRRTGGTRATCRLTCKAEGIIPHVVSFL